MPFLMRYDPSSYCEAVAQHSSAHVHASPPSAPAPAAGALAVLCGKRCQRLPCFHTLAQLRD